MYQLLLLTVGAFFAPLCAIADESGSGVYSGLDQAPSSLNIERSYSERFQEEMIASASAVTTDIDYNEEPGAVHFYKNFSYANVYDANVFYTRHHTKDDFLFIYTPLVGLERGRKQGSRSYLNAFYRFSYVDYVENQKLSRINQHLSTRYSYRLPKLSIDISNSFYPSSARDSSSRTEFSTTSGRTIVWSDDFSGVVKYDLTSKLKFSHTYQYSIDYYPASENGGNRGVQRLSEQSHTFIPRLTYQWTGKTSLYTDYGLQLVDFFKGGDFANKLHLLNFGATHQFSPKTGLTGQIGYAYRSYNRPDFKNGDAFTYRVNGYRRLTEKIDLNIFTSKTLGASYDLAGSLDRSQSLNVEQYSYGLNLAWRITPRMNLKTGPSVLFTHRDGYITLAEDDESHAIKTAEREDVSYAWDIEWSWLRGSAWEYYLAYSFYNRNSTFKNFEFENSRLVGSARYIF